MPSAVRFGSGLTRLDISCRWEEWGAYFADTNNPGT